MVYMEEKTTHILIGAFIGALFVAILWLIFGGSSSTAAAAAPGAVAVADPSSGAAIVCPYSGSLYTNPATKAQYCFYPGKDSDGNDIGVTGSFDKGLSACEADSTCLGFNSNGVYKNSLKPNANWVTWTTDPTKGFYTKAAAIGKY